MDSLGVDLINNTQRGRKKFMQHKEVIEKFKVPIYRSLLTVIVTNTIMKSIDLLEDQVDVKVHSDSERSSTRAYTFAYVEESGVKKFYLFLRPNCKPGELVHEIKHVVNLIFLWHGAKLSLTNDEPECYYLEQITNKVFEAVKKYNKLYPKPIRIKRNIDKPLTCIV